MTATCDCPYKGRQHRHYAWCPLAARNRPRHSAPRNVYEVGLNSGEYRCGVCRLEVHRGTDTRGRWVHR